MKSNSYLSIEAYGLLIGLFGAQLTGLALLFLPSFSSNANKLIYSDQPGTVVIALLIVMGVIGSVFFVINVLEKRSMRWHYRLTGFGIFYLALALIGVLGS